MRIDSCVAQRRDELTLARCKDGLDKAERQRSILYYYQSTDVLTESVHTETPSRAVVKDREFKY